MYKIKRKIPAIFLEGKIFGGGHRHRILHISKALNNPLYEFEYYPIDSFSKFLETIKKINNNNKIIVLDVAHSIICDYFNTTITKKYFNDLHPIIFDGVNNKTSISRHFSLGKCSTIVPYACFKEKLNHNNIVAAGESYFLYDLESEILSKKVNKSIDKILISFGNSDPSKLTESTLLILKKMIINENKFSYFFSSGLMFENLYKKRLLKYASDNFKCIDSDIKSVLPIIKAAITASGHWKYELALFDIPQLIIHISDEQKEANIPFEKFSGIKSYMKDELNFNLIKNFLYNLDEFKPSKEFLKNIKQAFIEKPTLSIIDKIIIKFLNNND